MRVLISAASRHGATREIARTLAGVLAEQGHKVQIVSPEQVESLDEYEAAIVGSAVYMGRWLTSARRLVRRLGDEFAARPVWLFSSGPIGDPPQPALEPSDAAALMAAIGAREHRVFAGRLERERLGLAERVAASALRVSDRDDRDWNEIAAWARAIAVALDSFGAEGVRVRGGEQP
ncbi:MAG: flavodoxin domain-containing protein [Actinocrinis sp.]